MLTDIFAYRYSTRVFWVKFTEVEQRLLNQIASLAKEVLPIYYENGSLNESINGSWKDIHNNICREIGLNELFPRYQSYTNQVGIPVNFTNNWGYMCERFITATFHPNNNPDSFIKERLSIIKLVMRSRHEQITKINAELPSRLHNASLPKPIGARILPGDRSESIIAINNFINNTYKSQVEELNERLRRSNVPLAYHNGHIQISTDETIEIELAKPFWKIISSEQWINVEIDMKEALDRRDSNGKDPAIFAAKALESTIMIISNLRGWTTGNERGASHFIDNLISKSNGKYIEVWEGELLKKYFTYVRNTVSHGPGDKPMPKFNISQTNWAIETAMSWIKSLISRL
ncbi:AbiJ-NTD4 domain-containing protein [Atlantibacter hermannii]|uniref:AbiJ-NTD4 domain-containing protein n=1 Tax=Atlantibacter hermannii TaxID=565 RepID=UPI0028A70798|nr:hypothetical protein [Atlantibacter hermannii]